MNLMSHPQTVLALVIVVSWTLLSSVAGGELPLNQSGTLLLATGKSMSGALPAAPSPAITVPEAISTAPIATESFSTIQYAPAEPALVLPVSTVFGPGKLGFVAMIGTDPNPFELIGEAGAVREASNRWGALIVAPLLLLSLGKRLRRQVASN